MKSLLTLIILLISPWALADESSQATKRIIFLGDSITSGYGLDKSAAYPSLLENLAKADGFSWSCLNAGLSGDTSAGGTRRAPILLRQPVDILFIALGGNDGLRGIQPEVTAKNLTTIIKQAKEKQPNMLIVLAGMQMPDNMGDDYTAAFREIYPQVAEAEKVHLIPFLLDGVAMEKELNLPDGIHPNAKGHEIIAQQVYQQLKTLTQGN
ncbi:arylesterase [Persicirhabdus sediminis]|uniref:Arylesterase n=1 Tax=Persicirhabdus sediminis TaxID=454144 RepID=A0A8J7MFB0_9BACT|nr:arylesterase [Persicirhabdus sediminis]MBK1791648.1 arylesterase [Persicirhabdus sediminis]